MSVDLLKQSYTTMQFSGRITGAGGGFETAENGRFKFKNASEAVSFSATSFSEITRFFAWGSCGSSFPRHPRRKSELFAKNR